MLSGAQSQTAVPTVTYVFDISNEKEEDFALFPQNPHLVFLTVVKV
jgi:hypothetical protein